MIRILFQRPFNALSADSFGYLLWRNSATCVQIWRDGLICL